MPVEGASRRGVAGGAGRGWGMSCDEAASAVGDRTTAGSAVAAKLVAEVAEGSEGIRVAWLLGRGIN